MSCSSYWSFVINIHIFRPALSWRLALVRSGLLSWCSTSKKHHSVGHLRQLTTKVAHVLPVSDDGGSTAEIVRVLGGPAVGDIRSRCLRLADDSNEEVCPSLAYRFLTSGVRILHRQGNACTV